jgi:5'-methylthioinosine phosphorylase
MDFAVIGGTGALDLFEIIEQREFKSRYGRPSAALSRIRLGSAEAWFLPRHGNPHLIAPHAVNYRANIDILRQSGASQVVAIHAVGGVDPALEPGSLVIPDQLIDYTWGRAHTFSDAPGQPLKHIEFAEPFAGPTRQALLKAAGEAEVEVEAGGCYAVTQGPRLETAAEIARLAADGCSLVGMTAMPEAALAREAGLDYASLSVVANPAAGVTDEVISIDEIHRVLARAMVQVRSLLKSLARYAM